MGMEIPEWQPILRRGGSNGTSVEFAEDYSCDSAAPESLSLSDAIFAPLADGGETGSDATCQAAIGEVLPSFATDQAGANKTVAEDVGTVLSAGPSNGIFAPPGTGDEMPPGAHLDGAVSSGGLKDALASGLMDNLACLY